MKKKGLETWLYSTIGVIAMFAVIVGINLISTRAKVRVDLTAEHAYTLSEGTRAILSKLDTPVQIRLYCTRNDAAMPVTSKTYAQRVEDLLGEFRQVSKGQIEIQKLDPEPESEAEDSAHIDGIEAQPNGRGDRFYLGASVTMLDQKEALPILAPEGEQTLEYDLIRAISRVATPTKAVVGVMSSLPVNGFNNPMMQRTGRRPQREWALMTELRRDFTVRTVEMTVDKIPDEVKVLLVIHPKDITDAAEYAIDQFVLRGGKLIAFLDPVAVLDASAASGPMGGASSSSLDKLLKAWGLTFNSKEVVADTTYAFQQREERTPVVLDITNTGISSDDPLTAGADRLWLPFAGAFSGTPADGLKETVLVKSSTNSQFIDPMLAQLGGEQIIKNLKKSGVEYTLALRLTGKFKTAYPEGKPRTETPPEEAKPGEKKPEPPVEPSLKESKEETAVLLIGDSDCLQDQVAAQMRMTSDGQVQPMNGNFSFAQNAVDQMAGDSNLIKVRSRASRERPFTVVNKIKADTEASYQTEHNKLDEAKRDAETKIRALMSANPTESGRRVVLPPETQAQLVALQKQHADVEKQGRLLVRKMNADIDALQTKTTWMNLAVMPIFVALTGIILAILRRRAHAAR